ncbi:MAG: hypothetical protein HC881_23865 [Leptolyngbyaceae cyanobacterium SL_7_1]|nr:hypothetical protein [Leptolyngbyaceae cyanobacterium SL_7_1]
MTSNRGTQWNPDQVAIEFDNSLGNLDLYLYDSQGNPINPTQGVTNGNGETVAISEVAGKIYIRVAGRNNSVTNPDYTLVFRGTPSLPNSFPTLQPSAFALAEQSATGTAVGTVIASDPENGAIAYALTAGNPDTDGDGIAAFALNPTTGVITVADGDELDFEQSPNFNLTVQVTDNVGQSVAGSVAINLVDVSEAPTLQTNLFEVSENSPDGTPVGQMQATDPQGNPISYSISAGNPDLDGDGVAGFAIDSLTGTITVADSGDLDYERNPSNILTIAAQNSTGLVGTTTATVNLSNIVGGKIQGTRGDDYLIGDDGNDVIVGGFGNDRITTLRGKDRIVFDIGRSFRQKSIGVDQILDFDRQLDRIVLDKTTFRAIEGGRIKLDSVKTSALAARSDELFTYVRSTGALYYNQNGTAGGFGSGGQFAQLTAGINLTSRNFLVQA